MSIKPKPNSAIKLKVNKNHDVWYDRPQSFCHMHGASTFAIYER